MGLFSLFSKKAQEPGDDHDMPVTPRRGRAAKAQDDEPLDPMLPEKKRARRRLIGAVALVLAAIIGLPMIFDSEPKPLTDDIDIQIPSRDKTEPSTSRPMPLPPESPLTGSTPDVAVVTPATNSATDTKPRSDIKAVPPVKLDADAKHAADDKKGGQTSATSTAPDSRKPVAPKPAAAPAATSPQTDKRSAAAATDKLAETIAERSRARFVVQVAAVSSEAKAEELQNRLKKAGIQSFSQKVSTRDGERFRIRIGPFGSREEADKMRGRLGPLGLSGTVQSV